MIVLCAKLTYLAIGVWGCVFLIGGGVFYTVGSVLYLLGKKSRRRYIHSVFHLFVVFGSADANKRRRAAKRRAI